MPDDDQIAATLAGIQPHRVFPPGCDGAEGRMPAGQRGPTGCLHHYAPGRNLAAEGCICPAWFDGGGWHVIDVNPECASEAHRPPPQASEKD